ncbi:MAG: SDR family oxidoreductase [Bacteroidales bacterium]|jgi:short-subunit dehydrogenase|nr:SDR family oxidoreductase [Bacteroidales bacterium]
MKIQKFYSGKVVWITGASSGIGEELARQLSEYGARLILSSRRKGELERVRASLKTSSENVFILPLDLAEPASLNEKAREAEKAFGRIDILVNNGGVSQRALALETPVEIDRKIMEINYFSGVILTKCVLPGMLARGYGHIASISSVTGKFGFPLRSAYAASKHAMTGFYESVGAEYHHQGIHTTIVFPGRIRTNISLGAIGPDGKPYNKMDPGQENGTPVEKCARDIIRGIAKNKREVFTGGKEILMVLIKRFLPSLSFRMARKVSRT